MKLLSITMLLFVYGNATAQNKSSVPDSLLTGTWKGSSLCQVKPSPCNDEIAVYHISKTARPNVYHVVMNKVVDGKEEDMAVYDYNWDAGANSLSCYDAAHKINWKFTVKSMDMSGELIYKNAVYRIIKLKKASGR
jgi:hypothetical protein